MMIIDASVAAKWYLPETGSEEAIELVESGADLTAPSLIQLEVLASITRCVREKRADAEITLVRCQRWQEFLDEGSMKIYATEDILPLALDLSISMKHPLQDCVYIALAKHFKAELVTADHLMAKHAKNISVKTRLVGTVH